jgi:hypothetical protein
MDITYDTEDPILPAPGRLAAPPAPTIPAETCAVPVRSMSPAGPLPIGSPSPGLIAHSGVKKIRG